jgi:hypothetical protein
LNEGRVAHAQLITLHLKFPDSPPLAKNESSRSDLIKFVRELYSSGLIKADWDPDKHPRWPAGAPDSQGGEFAPAGEGMLDDGVYHPNDDPLQIDPIADRATQVGLNRLQHEAQVDREVQYWQGNGCVVVRNVAFMDPRTGTRIVADFVVSIWLPDTETLFLTRELEPFLVRDVKTGAGPLTENQKVVYPYILAGGKVVPIGENAVAAGFDGSPTVIQGMYVGRDLPSDTLH